MGSHSNQARNLLLPQRIQPQQNRNPRLWQVSRPNQTRNLLPPQRSQVKQNLNLRLPMRSRPARRPVESLLR